MQEQYKKLLLSHRDRLSRHNAKIKNLCDVALARHSITADIFSLLELDDPLIGYWLAGTTINASRFNRYNTLLESRQHFITAWGNISPRSPDNRMQINQSRFLRWLDLFTDRERIDEFFSETQKMLDVFKTYRTDFDLSSLADVACKMQSSDFRIWAMNMFIRGQEKPTRNF